MPTNPAWIDDSSAASTKVGIDVLERPSPDLFTTTTADPGSGGTTLAVTANAKFPAVNGYKVRVENETMRVTAGAGTNSWTVTRGIDNTTAVAHTTGVTASLVVGVQRISPVSERVTTFLGRSGTFRTPGRAGTTGQKIFAIHNATGSPVNVNIHKITIDVVATVVKAVTVLPPVIRLVKFTAVPTNGTAMTKVAEDSNLTSSSSLTVWQDASADGTSSGTTLTVTLPAGFITQEFAPRLITAVGYEIADRMTFFEGEDETITLRPLEGLCLNLDYVLATQNPVTDMYVVNVRWEEFLTP